MNTLIAFTLLVAAAVAEPQFFYSGVAAPSSYYGGVYPYTSSLISPVISKTYSTPLVATSLSTPLVHSIHKRAAQFPASTSPLYSTPLISTYGAYPYSSSVISPLVAGAYATPYATTGLVHSIHKRAAVLPAVYRSHTTTPLVSTYGAYPYAYGAYNGVYNGAYSTYPYVL